MKWISEVEALPPAGQPVFYMAPRQADTFWDVKVARLHIRYDGARIRPVKPGDEWPTDFWWSMDHFNSETGLVTGNGWWAWMDDIPLPPGAEHRRERDQHYIAQIGNVFVSQRTR